MLSSRFVLGILIFLAFSLVCSAAFGFSLNASALDDPKDSQTSGNKVNVKFLEQSSFVDASGRINVMGTVRNTGTVPLHVSIGVNVLQDAAQNLATITNETYGSVIWPLTDSPFKLTLSAGQKLSGPAFLASVSETNTTNYSLLTLDYTNMAVGESRSLVGTVKNNGPFDVYDLSIFASVHDANMTQLDSVKTKVIPVLHVGEQQSFAVSPDPVIRSKAYYYSCAGLDLKAPITTVDLGGGNFLAFDLQALAKVSSIGYDNGTRSIVFDVAPYGLDGGPILMKIPQSSSNQDVQVFVDNHPVATASINSDGRTISVETFVPKGEHHVQIENVTTVPEFPLATWSLAGAIMLTILLARNRLHFAFANRF